MCDGSVPQAKQAQQGALCQLTQLVSDGAGEPKSQCTCCVWGSDQVGELPIEMVQSGRLAVQHSAAGRAIDRRVTKMKGMPANSPRKRWDLAAYTY